MSDPGAYWIRLIDWMWSFVAASHDGQGCSGLYVVGILLLNSFIFFSPLACASPLDPVWTDSLYDDGDYDEITRVVNISGLSDVEGAIDTSHDSERGHILLVAGAVTRLRDTHFWVASLVTYHTRAPPAGHPDPVPLLNSAAVSPPFLHCGLVPPSA